MEHEIYRGFHALGALIIVLAASARKAPTVLKAFYTR